MAGSELDEDEQQPYALYLVKYVQEMKKEGVESDAIVAAQSVVVLAFTKVRLRTTLVLF